MKVIIPVAGLGSRLKPHTFSLPKPLMEVAGRPILDYIIEDVKRLKPDEIVFVVGYMGEMIREFVETHYPHLNTRFVFQRVRDGDGSAIRLALEGYEKDDELFIVFGDTMVDFEYKKVLQRKKGVDCLVLAMEVENPENFGILNIREDGDIYRIEEKPSEPKSNLAVIGAYYFSSLFKVKKILDEYYTKKINIKGEYKIAQVIERYINNKDLRVKSIEVDKWFDCGLPETLLNANKYFLEKKSKGEAKVVGNSLVIPPSYVASSAILEHSIIGPYASIGEDVVVMNSTIEDSVISTGSKVKNFVLKGSIIGRDVTLCEKPVKVSIGERSLIDFD